MKINRKNIKNKYGGRCTYCGNLLEEKFHVDHEKSKRKNGVIDDFENLNPACSSCNLRKSTLSVDEFRQELKNDIVRLRKNNPKFRLLEKYGLIVVKNESVIFYFERQEEQKLIQEATHES